VLNFINFFEFFNQGQPRYIKDIDFDVKLTIEELNCFGMVMLKAEVAKIDITKIDDE
jgi:hypothetical protein